VMDRLAKKYSAEYDKNVTVGTTAAIPGVVFGMGIDLSKCNGSRECVTACVKENNTSRDPEIQWITVLEMEKEKSGVTDLEKGNRYYDAKTVPKPGYFYLPIACQQCENPPCVKVCPTGSCWTEKDGIVVIDYDWCIGCRYCMAACPYGARHINLSEPEIPKNEMNPNTHYLGNRPRHAGSVEKCTFCIQRTRKGQQTACVEACPTGARVFGNLLDPNSDISYMLKTKRVFRLKEEMNTEPKFFYFFSRG